MERNIKGRNDAATSRRPAAERSCEGDQLNPQLNNNTSRSIEQEEAYLDYETECEIVRRILEPYNKTVYRKLPRPLREVLYLKARSLFTGLNISPAAKDFGYRLISEFLGL